MSTPAGTKGISLFLVPKFLPAANGSEGPRNDVRCLSIERKLGLHASPTCTMSYGENDACIGFLLGKEYGGMRAMFTMMNVARINVGLEGVAIAERAYQGALNYARDRIQSAPIGGGATPVPIILHPDVRRMLLTLRSTTQAIRAIAYFNAAAVDRARAESAPDARAAARARAELLTPITKAYATDQGVAMASLALQVFGGMGFIEDTGAAQHYRDIRIAPIYEGTNGIQGLDLVGRKMRMDGGAHWRSLLGELGQMISTLPDDAALTSMRSEIERSLARLDESANLVMELDLLAAAAIATPFLNMFGITLGAVLLARQAGGRRQLLLPPATIILAGLKPSSLVHHRAV